MSTITVDNRGRYHTPDGDFPRVSSIAGMEPARGLDLWKKRLGAEAQVITEAAADHGTLLHDVTMYDDMGNHRKRDALLDTHPDIFPSLLWWREWVAEYVRLPWVTIETVVWSVRLRVAGRVDRVAYIKGDRYPSILDLKTGRLVDDIGIKLALYRQMWNEVGRRVCPVFKRADRTMAVGIHREGRELKIKEYTPEMYKGRRYVERGVQLCEDYNALVISD